MSMQIIIPMAGIGQRFIDAGYKTPKPWIETEGRAIIEHVVALFPEENDFIFVCNEDHLRNGTLKQILKNAAPSGKVLAIKPHKKGPVYTISQIFDYIEDEGEVIVNYCDFSTKWNYFHFLNTIRENNVDGSIVAYRGFHPHMLGSTHYAFIQEENLLLKAIKEKEPFTTNRMEEYASNGTYYFKFGKFLKKYFRELLNENIHVNNEYYVSLTYNLMVQDKLKVSIYPVEYMLQWGTPQDLEEQQNWSRFFTKNLLVENKHQMKGISLIPMSGKGERFKLSHSLPKPLIPISGAPMVVQAMKSLPSFEEHIFVCLENQLQDYPLENELRKEWPHCKIVSLKTVTEGQAITCKLGLENENLDQPLFISACDHKCLMDQVRFQKMCEDSNLDVIVWSFRNHPSSNRNPHMYGWLKTDRNGYVEEVSVKKALSDNPKQDHAIVGTFYFKKGLFFIEALNEMIQKDSRINGEFYVDTCIDILIKKGHKVKVFEVDQYICWGTPDDVKTYEYWESYYKI